MHARQRTRVPADDQALALIAEHHGAITTDTEQLAAQRARLSLVRQLPERPRRFLLRTMLGYTYSEIAAQENASHTTTNHQITRAKRLLRRIDEHENAIDGGQTHPPSD